MIHTHDLRITRCDPLMSPQEIRDHRPLSESARSHIHHTRRDIANIMRGEDPRCLVLIGPCSIHDDKAAYEYAEKLLPIAENYPELLVVMRTYFEKPRTTIGWKGLINDPFLDNSNHLNAGITLAREITATITEMGLPCATEFLDPMTPQYLADAVCWAAIGARTTESQTHREMASGLSMPVGFKNGTDGQLDIAFNAMKSAAHPHVFRGLAADGRIARIEAAGNPDTHLVLRGSVNGGANCDARSIASVHEQCQQAGACDRVIVDLSHDNTRPHPGGSKDYRRQVAVCADVAQQIANCRAESGPIGGVMIESHLVAGNQSLSDNLCYGQSITDGCINLDDSTQCLEMLAEAVRRKSPMPP